jgi:hypothetical protein
VKIRAWRVGFNGQVRRNADWLLYKFANFGRVRYYFLDIPLFPAVKIMSLVQPAPGVPVLLANRPGGIAMVEQVSSGMLKLRLQDGTVLEASDCSRFFEQEVPSARLAHAALTLAHACESAGQNGIAGKLREAVGNDLRDLPYLMPTISRALIVAVAGTGDLAMKLFGEWHGVVLTVARRSAGLSEDADLATAAHRIASDDTHQMPPTSWPGREDPASAGKDRAILDDGILPGRFNRSFFCGAYDIETGEIVEVRSYAETGYGELHHGEFFSRGVASRIDRGLYGFFVAHENGNVYAHWRVSRGTVADGAFTFLAGQFTVDGERPRIFEEMQRAAGEVPWYMRRTDPENDRSWETAPGI